MSEIKQIGFFEADPNFREQTAQTILRRTTALIKVSKGNDGKVKNTHIGSGTFVLVEGKHGILTAQHVAECLDEPCRLGLGIDLAEHKFTIPSQHLIIIPIGKRATDELGPDLAFITLPRTVVGTINSLMGFYDLTSQRQQILESPPDLNLGWWILAGVPEIGTKLEPSTRGFKQVMVFEYFACEGSLNKTFTAGEFDYAEMPIDLTRYLNTPPSFKGMSGGGLWQILIEEQSGTLKVTQYLLSGVIFYQSELISNGRSVRSHFRSSLYKVAYDEITKGLSSLVE